MAPSRRQKPQPPTDSSSPVTDYRHDSAKRKNIPPAGLAAQGKVAETPKLRFAYDPHLPPVLRFDPTGRSDELPELLQIAMQRALNATEARTLADALRNRQPWLEWAGKREKKACEVDPIAVHIHERSSPPDTFRALSETHASVSPAITLRLRRASPWGAAEG